MDATSVSIGDLKYVRELTRLKRDIGLDVASWLRGEGLGMTIWTIKYSGNVCNGIVNLKSEMQDNTSHDIRICYKEWKI